jgi:putative YphP/YqiW family bacilliredoxin
MKSVPYPPELVDPMRGELTRLGFQELRTAEEAERELEDRSGTLLLVVNSVCGCAAGNARPGVALALEEGARPDRLLTVFAGQDLDATERARQFLPGYAPSSPSMALLRDGEVVAMLERKDIEGRTPVDVARDLRAAFEQHCRPLPR